jgi:phospholipid/cholesterol/gamma-HCH transport system substrate-binding protein
LLLVGIGLTAASVFWIRGMSVQGQSYSMEVQLPDASGINVGSAVQYRGVKVGQVTRIKPQLNGVLVGFRVESPDLLLARNSTIETSQSGFVGQTILSISPQESVPQTQLAEAMTPFSPNCDPAVILCDGDRLTGQAGINFDELIRATTKIATLLGDGQLLNNTNTTLKNLSLAALSFRDLSRNINTTLGNVNTLSRSANQQLTRFGTTSDSITLAANTVADSAGRVGEIGDRFLVTADQLNTTADEVTRLIQENRGTLISTLGNLDSASQDLKVSLAELRPVISQVQSSKIIENLDRLTANGAELTQSLKGITSTANNPVILLGLAQTLDSARVTFQNAQKITTDLESLTGNAEFRENLIKLINSLSKLLSSTQELERQYHIAQTLQAAEETAPSLPPTQIPPPLPMEKRTSFLQESSEQTDP